MNIALVYGVRSITMHYLHIFIFYICSYPLSMLDAPFFVWECVIDFHLLHCYL